MHRIFSIVFLLLFYPQIVQSQNAIWQMTHGYQFDLTTSPPTIKKANNVGKRLIYGYDNALNTTSCSTVSDDLDELLFYSDGYAVYDRLHQIMPNGDNLCGDKNTRQSSLIIPRPDHERQYYLITAGTSEASDTDTTGQDYYPVTSYSIINLSLNDDLGDIMPDQKRIHLNQGGNLGLTAVQGHCNIIGQ